MRTALFVATVLFGFVMTSTPAAAENGPCAGTPQNNCRPLCETGDIRGCIGDPQLACVDLVIAMYCT